MGSNNAGNGDTRLAALLDKGRVRKMICSFPRRADSWVFDGLYRSGRIEGDRGAAAESWSTPCTATSRWARRWTGRGAMPRTLVGMWWQGGNGGVVTAG